MIKISNDMMMLLKSKHQDKVWISQLSIALHNINKLEVHLYMNKETHYKYLNLNLQLSTIIAYIQYS